VLFVRAEVAPDGTKPNGLDRATGVTLVDQAPPVVQGKAGQVDDANQALVEFAQAKGIDEAAVELAKSYYAKAG
jgi:hypothetical protein